MFVNLVRKKWVLALVGSAFVSGSAMAATMPASGLQDVVNYSKSESVPAGSAIAERGGPKQMLEAYLPASTVKTEVTNSSNSLYRQQALKVALPMTDVTQYKQIPAFDGFPKEIPSFAKDTQVFYVPQFMKAGGEAQVAFKGTADELAPYRAEAMKLAIMQTNLTDSRSVYIKMEPNSDMRYAPSLRELLPDYRFNVSKELSNLGPWHDFWSDSIDGKKQALNGQSKTQLFDERTNKELQQNLLGYYSYTYTSQPLGSEYEYYIFKVGTTFEHPYVTGAAFDKTGTEVIYFYRQL